jgi:hypothetical protein
MPAMPGSADTVRMPRPPIRTVRLVLPSVLIALGVAALAGCIYVPVHDPPPTLEATDAREAVGRPGSGRRLLVGEATWRDVQDLLGEPAYRSDDGRAYGYAYRMRTGAWVGLCGHEEFKFYDLLLDFDRGGVLRDYRLVTVPFDYDQPLAWQKFLRERARQRR